MPLVVLPNYLGTREYLSKCFSRWHLLSHIVVKGSRSFIFPVFTGSVKGKHSKNSISGLKHKQQAVLIFQRRIFQEQFKSDGSRAFESSELHEV
jgi:hypothetical protein